MKLKHTSLLLVLFLAAIAVSARQDSLKTFGNTVLITGTDYMMPPHKGWRTMLIPYDEQIGVSYQRKIWKNIWGAISYSEWNNTLLYPNLGKYGFIVSPAHATYQPGIITDMVNYKTIDLYALYIVGHFTKHKIKFGLGISYTSGLNEVVDYIYHNPDPPHDGIIYTHSERKSYIGVVPCASYSYLIWRKRIAIGVDVRYRIYMQHPFYKPEYGFHVGVNF